MTFNVQFECEADRIRLLIIIPCIGIIAIIMLLFMLRDDSAGSFSFDQNGFTLYTKKERYHHAWTDFKYIEVVPLNVESVGTRKIADIYMIVFSTFYLTPQRKRDLMGKTTKDLTKIAYFQYRKEVVDEMLSCMPAEMAQILKEKCDIIETHMNKLECFYNR